MANDDNEDHNEESTRRKNEEEDGEFRSSVAPLLLDGFNEHTLYALDLIVIRNLTRAVLDYESRNAPAFLFIQDKFFLRNLFAVLNRLLDKRYDLRLAQLAHRLQEEQQQDLIDNSILDFFAPDDFKLGKLPFRLFESLSGWLNK